MPFDKQGNFTKKPTDLPDTPSPLFSPSDIKEHFQKPADELKTTFNKLVDDMAASTGAVNIGAKKDDGTASTVQASIDEKATKTALSDLQTQLNGAVISGDSSPQIDLALAGTPYTTLREKHQAIDGNIDGRGINVMYPPAPLLPAVGDNVTDDTARLHAIAEYAYGKGLKIILPEKKFKITSSLVLKDTITIEGAKGALNKDGSYIILHTSLDIPAIVIKKDDGTQLFDVYLKNITVSKEGLSTDTNLPNTIATGIQMSHVSESRFENISVSGFNIGFELRSTSICDFVRPKIYYCNFGLWLGNNDVNEVARGFNGVNNFYFGNWYRNITDVVAGGDQQYFVGCHLEYSKQTSFLLDNKYSAQVSHYTLRDCNIRQYDAGARSIKINAGNPTSALYLFQFILENTFMKVNGTCAIEKIGTTSGATTLDLTVQDCSVWGVSECAVKSNSSFKVRKRGRMRIRSGTDGSGNDMKLVGGSAVVHVDKQIALLKLSANQTITTGTNTMVSWGTKIEDDKGFWSATAPTRLTIPNGVSKVRITSNLMWATNGTGQRIAEILKNGTGFAGMPQEVVTGFSSFNSYSKIESAIVSVVEGDYFEVRVSHNAGVNLDITNNDRTWVLIETIE